MTLVTAAKGSILVQTGGTGNLSVAAGSTLTANSGALTLQNTNTATGQILIGAGATVETQGKGKNTTLVIGATVPTAGTNPTTTNVPGITVTVAGKGVVFLGPVGSVTATTAFANAINKNVIFQGTTAGSIVLGAGATITADPPSATPECGDTSGSSSSSAICTKHEWSVRIRQRKRNIDIRPDSAQLECSTTNASSQQRNLDHRDQYRQPGFTVRTEGSDQRSQFRTRRSGCP